MRKQIICLVIILFLGTECLCETDSGRAQYFGSDDLHLRGGEMTSYQLSSGQHVLVFNKGFDAIIGDNRFTSGQAVVWLDSTAVEYHGVDDIDYKVKVYLQDKVKVERGSGSKTSGLNVSQPIIDGAESLVVEGMVSGEVFATADTRIEEDPRASEVYYNALVATGQIKPEPAEEQVASAEESQLQLQQGQQQMQQSDGQQKSPGVMKKVFGRKTKRQKQMKAGQSTAKVTVPPLPAPPAPKFQYPVNISSATDKPIRITNETLADDTSVATILDRFYLWQKKNEDGGLLEFQADCAVIFYSKSADGQKEIKDALPAESTVKAIYLRGNIIMTEGSRTIRADEAYYDFQKKQALAVNSVIRTFDPDRGIPIYVRAEKIRQVAEDKFTGKNVTVTSSEFYVPKISMTASEIFITDLASTNTKPGKTDKHLYNADMRNVKMKLDNRTVFYWPRFRSNLERPDIPLKKAQFSRDSSFGTSIETEWYLARILGLKEPSGVDSSLMIDSYSKRGTGAGADIRYQKDDYFGTINGYVINDKGDDDLGRNRQDIKPEKTMRGMLNFQHRHFLQEHWQLTLESSYMSDENFLEAFRRQEYFTGRGRETAVHLKWIKDNQAFAILGRWRINDFADQLEDLPSAQYHLTGQSIFDDKLTLYNDNMIGRFRQRTGKDHGLTIKDEYFTFGSTRTEIDMPLKFSKGNIVPFAAGIFGYDDRSGFDRNTAIGAAGSTPGDENVFIGQAGVRASTQYWKHYNVHSTFWDIDGIRHIVKPYANASVFTESSDAVAQKDVVSLGVLQRWQTKRGIGDKSRILDWMRLNLEYSKVSDNSEIRRPDRTLWNNPFVPLSTILAPGIFNSDLGSSYRSFELFGPQRDSINADYIWRLSDTTAILSDFNYDVQDREFEQFNIGLSRMVWPNLSYYIGTRYIRSVEIDDEKGSNAFTFAMTYKLSPRYTVSFSHQYDFKRDGRISTQVSLIRRYHRLYYGLTYGIDESLDRRTIVLTIWPEGIGEMSGGSGTLRGIDTPRERNY